MTSTANILLVEDDPDDVRFIERSFAKVWLKHQLHVVSDGEQALKFVRNAPGYEDSPLPDLILLDLNMPRKNGYEVLVELKNDDGLKHIPVVVLTTSSDYDSVMKSYKLHANSFISKPVSANELNEVVSLVVNYWFNTVGLPQEK